jgi:three-Cys-motif partner protein
MFHLPPPGDDQLETPTVGNWSRDKHHFLRRYIDAFTTAMKKKRWRGLHYIDLFAGAGIEGLDDGTLDWGSPLIAAQSPTRFSRLHLCELNKRRYTALQKRLSKFPQPTEPQVIHGDANKEVATVAKSVPAGTLSLAFLDPHGLHLHFSTLRELSALRADLIIFFPDHLDALRNWEIVYRDNPNSNLDQVLGTGSWREAVGAAPQDRWADVLSKLYLRQIRTLDFRYFDQERISLPNGRFLYKLIFCSKSKIGADIWRGIAGTSADGQRSLGFPE